MSKKRASSKRREKERGPGRDSVVVFHAPAGVEVPRGLGLVGSSEPDKGPRPSRGWTLERASDAFWEGLREKRKSSDPQSEFSRTWDEFQTRAGRLRVAVQKPRGVWSGDSISELIGDALTAGRRYHGIDIVSFRRGERKDDCTQEYLRNWSGGEGVLYIGKAQEKARVQRTERRRRPSTGATYAWLVDSTALVNHYYFYAVDDDFGPFFLKFCSYFPYNAKLCINGHEYLKRQLTKRGIGFEPLDNGILRCADPAAMQRLADGLTAEKIDALLRKWLARLPHPFSANDREQGIRYAGGRRGEPEGVGDDGTGGAQHRGDQRRQIEVALAGGAHDAGQHLLAVGAVAGAVATADLSDNDGGTDGLFGAPVGRVDRQVPQEEKHGSEFGGQMPGKALGVVQRWRCVNQPTELGHESAADRCQTVLAQLAVVAAVTHGKARLQDRLHLAGPETVGMIFLQFLASSE